MEQIRYVLGNQIKEKLVFTEVLSESLNKTWLTVSKKVLNH